MNGQEIELPEGFVQGDFKIGLIDIIREQLANDRLPKRFVEICNKILDGDKTTIGIFVLTFIVGCFVVNQFFSSGPNENQKSEPNDKPEKEPEVPERDFTIAQLRDFDGTNDKQIYISLRNVVYDVSGARDFYGVDSSYHCFAGREASRAMAKLSFDEAELCNTRIDDLGPYEISSLDGWEEKFKYYKSYPVVGRVSFPPHDLAMSRAELLSWKSPTEIPDGRLHAPIYMGIKGKILDVSYGGVEMYGPGGPYHIFAGIDASRALGKMSFTPEDTSSHDLSDLNAEQVKTLDDWERKFIEAKKYPVVGRLID